MSAIVQLVAASLLWSLSFGLIKTHLSDLHPAFIGFARLALTLPVFLPLLSFRGLERTTITRLLTIGAVQYGLAYSTYLFAYRYLEGHHVALLTIFTPLWVVAFDAIRARKLHGAAVGFAVLAVGGAAVISYRTASFDAVLIGVLLMQVANACFAWGQLAYRDLRRAHPQLRDARVFGLLYVGAVLVAALTTTVLGGWDSAQRLDATHGAVLVYLGVIASGVGFFLWNRGAVHTAPSTLAVLNNLKIPLAVAATLVVFGETTNLPRLLAGGSLMVLAAWGAQRFSRS